jgi:hypothetical protein
MEEGGVRVVKEDAMVEEEDVGIDAGTAAR